MARRRYFPTLAIHENDRESRKRVHQALSEEGSARRSLVGRPQESVQLKVLSTLDCTHFGQRDKGGKKVEVELQSFDGNGSNWRRTPFRQSKHSTRSSLSLLANPCPRTGDARNRPLFPRKRERIRKIPFPSSLISLTDPFLPLKGLVIRSLQLVSLWSSSSRSFSLGSSFARKDFDSKCSKNWICR